MLALLYLGSGSVILNSVWAAPAVAEAAILHHEKSYYPQHCSAGQPEDEPKGVDDGVVLSQEQDHLDQAFVEGDNAANAVLAYLGVNHHPSSDMVHMASEALTVTRGRIVSIHMSTISFGHSELEICRITQKASSDGHESRLICSSLFS